MAIIDYKGNIIDAGNELNISSVCKPELPIELPWKYSYIQKAVEDGSTVYYNLANTAKKGYCYHLKAGIEYVAMIDDGQLRYWSVDPRTIQNKELTDQQATNMEYLGYDPTQFMVMGVVPTSLGLSQTVGLKITPDTDMYLNVDDTTPGSFAVYKASEMEWLGNKDGLDIYWARNAKAYIYAEPFTFNTVAHGAARRAYYEQYETDEKMRRVIRQTDWLDALALSNFNLCFIGDSITFAASNAGLQRAFRKMVPYKLQVNQISTAQNGACMTNGFGYGWENGDGTMGVDGLFTAASYIQTVPDSPFERPHIFVIALGTNDYGNNAPLGDVEAEDRDTTFAGCYLKLVEAIRANYPKAGIILMCPFNRETTTANEKGHVLLDYCRVIHEIASFTPHTWVLDLSGHPLINHAGYNASFVDYVHINKYGHAVVSNELYRLIMEIVAVCGFDYLPCLDNLNIGL